MTWLQLSLKEWRRRPLRMGITSAGIAIAIAALFSLLAFHRGYQDRVRQELEHLGAQVLVVPKGCPYDAASIALHGANWPCYLKESYLVEVRSVRGIATSAPNFMTAVYDTQGNQFVYVGVDTNMVALKPGWKIQGSFPVQEGEILVGMEVARRYGWKPGERVHLPGVNEGTGKVAGILAPTQGADDAFIFLRLADAQNLFRHPHEMTHVLVKLKDPNDLDPVVAQLRGCDAGLAMNVIPLTHVYRTLQSFVNSTRLLLSCFTLVALLVAATGVSNTLLMAVNERTREIGVMRAIGASRGHVFRWILLETLQLCLVGAVIGTGLAFLASRLVENWVRSTLPFAPNGSLIHWEWLTAAGCLVCALLLGSFAAFLPAWRAASVPPMRALRAVGNAS
jgi:putative ABC transport system permease protein